MNGAVTPRLDNATTLSPYDFDPDQLNDHVVDIAFFGHPIVAPVSSHASKNLVFVSIDRSSTGLGSSCFPSGQWSPADEPIAHNVFSIKHFGGVFDRLIEVPHFREYGRSATVFTELKGWLRLFAPSAAPSLDPSIEASLASYAELNQSDWDGYGAEPIATSTLAYARKLLAVMPSNFGLPDIAPGGDGSVGLEWHPAVGKVRKLFLDIGPGEHWSAYWKTRSSDESGRASGRGFGSYTKRALESLFQRLS